MLVFGFWQNVRFKNTLVMCDKWGMETLVSDANYRDKRSTLEVVYQERAK